MSKAFRNGVETVAPLLSSISGVTSSTPRKHVFPRSWPISLPNIYVVGAVCRLSIVNLHFWFLRLRTSTVDSELTGHLPTHRTEPVLTKEDCLIPPTKGGLHTMDD